MFDSIAPRYDLVNRVLTLGIDGVWRAEAVRLATAGAPDRILDAATGTADLAVALKRSAPAADVVGIDFAERMLEVGRAKARRAGLDVRLDVGDALDLPYPDASFDAVTIAYGLRNFGDVGAGLREFRRVLRPGGRLVVLEFTPPRPGLLGRAMRFYTLRVVPWIGGWLSGRPGAYRYLNDSVMAFLAPDALADRLYGAGFDAVRYRVHETGISAVHVADVAPGSGAAPAPGEGGGQRAPTGPQAEPRTGGMP